MHRTPLGAVPLEGAYAAPLGTARCVQEQSAATGLPRVPIVELPDGAQFSVEDPYATAPTSRGIIGLVATFAALAALFVSLAIVLYCRKRRQHSSKGPSVPVVPNLRLKPPQRRSHSEGLWCSWFTRRNSGRNVCSFHLFSLSDPADPCESLLRRRAWLAG